VVVDADTVVVETNRGSSHTAAETAGAVFASPL
jgi:hypothetical protein